MSNKLSKKVYKVVVLFEGRDTAGKGGTIKRIIQCLNHRICRVVALGVPTEREKSQWYFQRYVAELPAAGEMVLLDRSWYNRAGVERVMGFCSDDEYWQFLKDAPRFEDLLMDAGIILIKYWFVVSEEEQEKRFKSRIEEPTKRWKFSDMDMKSRMLYDEYTKVRDIMFEHTHTERSPWYIVDSNNKKRARLNCINHLLSMIPHEDLTRDPFELPEKPKEKSYKSNMDQLGLNFVPEIY